MLTDGLEAEREQGITIDVAYRYFATKTRKFIIADAPGHEQYTRNMVTAAAGSDAAVVLVDITKIDWKASPVPLLAQTRRHSLLAHLLRVPNIVFAINKLDAIEQDTETAFNNVKASLEAFAQQAGINSKGVIPVSALRGDNVTTPSASWTWYQAPPAAGSGRTAPSDERHDGALLHPVQYVTRDSVGEGEATASGTGPPVPRVLGPHCPRRRQGWRRSANLPDLAKPPSWPKCVMPLWWSILAKLVNRPASCWTVRLTSRAATGLPRPAASSPPTASPPPGLAGHRNPLWSAANYWVRHGNRWVQARITSIDNKLDIHTLSDQEASRTGRQRDRNCADSDTTGFAG